MAARKIGNKPKAFIIMPFSADFQIVYKELLKPILVNAGFDVTTADILNQQNVLRDIVVPIAECALVVADLTLENGNVYYELGIAHTLGKKVVIVTQDRDTVPFDLRQYRNIKYGTHIKDVASFRKELRSVAKGALEGNVEFSNPVTDFLRHTSYRQAILANWKLWNLKENGIIMDTPDQSAPERHETDESGSTAEQEEEDEAEPHSDDREFLDHLFDLAEGFTRLTTMLYAVAEGIEDIGKFAQTKTKELEATAKLPGSKGAFHRLNIVRDMAGKLRNYAKSLAVQNAEYESVWEKIDTSLEYVISFPKISTPDDKEAFMQTLIQLSTVEQSSAYGRDMIVRLNDSIAKLKGSQKDLSAAVHVAERELKRLADNVESTRSSLSRALRLGKEKLGLPDDFDFTRGA